MTITVGSTVVPIPYPISDNETFWQNFLRNLFDGTVAGAATPSRVLIADANGSASSLMVVKPVKAIGTSKTLAVTDAPYLWALDTATGSAATLPAASGSGLEFMFFVKALATGGSATHTILCAGSDTFTGMILGSQINAVFATFGFAAQAGSKTITLNETSTGSADLGEYVSCRDIASGKWLTSGMLSSTGTAFLTPYS